MVSLITATWLLCAPARAEAPDAGEGDSAASPAQPATDASSGAASAPAPVEPTDVDPSLRPVKPASGEVVTGDTLGMSGAGGTPEYYTVQNGDTLWDISNRFLGNAYYWPKLWSINDQITNPHWIYPGNRIRFTLGTLLEPPQVGLDTEAGRGGYTVAGLNYGEADAACGPDLRFNFTLPSSTYRSLGILADDNSIDIVGKVPRARTGGSMIAESDLIYLEMDHPDAYECGDLISIIRPIQRHIKHPSERGTKYGTMYRIVGEARVVDRSGKWISARVRTSYTEIARGDLISPLIPTTMQLEVEKPDGDVEGTVIARLNDEAILARPGDTVFLDRGSADGLRVGSSLYVVERRDEFIDHETDESDLPESVVGRVVIVRVDEYASTAVITDSSSNVDVGSLITQHVE